MSPNAARLAVGIALIPFLPGMFWISFFALEDLVDSGRNEYLVAFTSYEACATIAVAVWLLPWWRAVEWNRRKLVATVLLAIVLLVSPVGLLGLPEDRPGEAWQLFWLLLPILAYALWLAGTAWVWRSDRPRLLPQLSAPDTAAEVAAVCPTCGYSLRGLHEVRCPECGWVSTVDDIVGRSIARVLAVP